MNNSPTTFQSLAELTRYLGDLEERVAALETENTALREKMILNSDEGIALAKYVKKQLPPSMLFSSNFVTRAFAVWGHYFVSQLIIGIGFFILYIIFVVVILGSGFRGG
jgi:hypothetical protein